MTERRKTIMVIDDEVNMVNMLKTVFAKEGYEVVGAYDGEDGFRKLLTVTPHLIVLDMNMPKMGGVDFYHEICNGYDGMPKYPILVLTARANMEKLFHDLNVDGFMTKPFEIADLIKEVETIITKRYGKSLVAAPKAEQRQRRILIVEDSSEVYDKMVLAFLNAGYVVNAAKSGASAFERAASDRPDLILIKMGLSDLPGDILASKLKHMPKTADIPVLLYTTQDSVLDDGVAEQICKKIGIRKPVETNDPSALLKEVNLLFG